VIYTADGQIKRRSLQSGHVVPIEFTAAVSFVRTPYTRATRDFDSRAARPVRGIMAPTLSPDGTQVAFAALGDLWVMPVGGAARRLTDDRFVEMDPTWSPDGRSLAYSSDRAGSMDLWVRDLQSGAEQKVASAATKASWAPRGTEIAFVTREGGIAVTGRSALVHRTLKAALRDQIVDDLAMHVGEPEVAARMAIHKLRVVQAHEVQQGGGGQGVLRQLFGQPDVAHHARDTGNNLCGLDAPDRRDRLMGGRMHQACRRAAPRRGLSPLGGQCTGAAGNVGAIMLQA
jgi:hypothetical protein